MAGSPPVSPSVGGRTGAVVVIVAARGEEGGECGRAGDTEQPAPRQLGAEMARRVGAHQHTHRSIGIGHGQASWGLVFTLMWSILVPPAPPEGPGRPAGRRTRRRRLLSRNTIRRRPSPGASRPSAGVSTMISRWPAVTTYCSTSPKWATLATTPGNTFTSWPGSVVSSRKHSGRTAAIAPSPGLDLLLRASDLEHGAVVGDDAVGVGGAPPEIVAADESGDERRGRALVDGLGVGQLLDVAVEHDRDPVAHAHRLFLVVGDEDEGDAELGLEQLELDLHLLAELAIERAERLVEQQHAGPIDERPGERHPLLLAAGQLARLAGREVAHLDHVERIADTVGDLRLGDAALPQPVGHVLGDVHVREQGVALEHGVDVALVGRDALHRTAR